MSFLNIMCFFIGLLNCHSFPLELKTSDSVCPEINLQNGEVIKPTKTMPLHRFRCNDGFTLYGSHFSTCTPRGLWYPEIPKCIKHGCQKPTLENGRVHEPKSGSYKNALISFSCKNEFRRNGPDKLLCNGFQWNDSPPTCMSFKPKDDSVECDFEDIHLCGWGQDIYDDIDWTRWRGQTVTNDTGPYTDYTTGTDQGHYVFLESSSPHFKGEKANLISMILPASYAMNKCLKFFYHMFGKDIGSLSVFVTPANIDTSVMNDSYRIFQVTGNQSKQWLLGEVPLPILKIQFKIIIQGTVGGSFGDIALDDVKISTCSGGLKKALNSTTVSKRTTTKPKAATIKTTLRTAPSVMTTKLFLSTNEPKLASSKSYKTNPFRIASTYPHMASKDLNLASPTGASYRSQGYDGSGGNITQGSHSDPTVDSVHVKTTVKGTSPRFSHEPSSIKEDISGNEKTYIKEHLQTSKYNKHHEEYHGTDKTSETSNISESNTAIPRVTHAESTLDPNPVDKFRSDDKIEDAWNELATVRNINNRDKLPSDDDLSKSKPKKTLNWLFIVLLLVVSAIMVLISVVIWQWAKRNQRAKLEGCYKRFENKDCQLQRHNQAETCLETEGSLIRDN